MRTIFWYPHIQFSAQLERFECMFAYFRLFTLVCKAKQFLRIVKKFTCLRSYQIPKHDPPQLFARKQICKALFSILHNIWWRLSVQFWGNCCLFYIFKLLAKLSIKVLLENGWNSKEMITEGGAAISLKTTRHAFGNQEKSKQRSAIVINQLSSNWAEHIELDQ